MVLVLVNTIANNFYAKLVRGIEDAARISGYNVMICATHGDRAIEDAYLQLLLNKAVDGAVFTSTTLPEAELLLLNERYPLVLCDEHYVNEALTYVGIDNETAAYEAGGHLVQQGRKRIVHVSVDNCNQTTLGRLCGYKRALAESGILFDPKLLLFGNYGYRVAYAKMDALLHSGTKADAAFAVSDRMAAASINAAQAHGMRVPQDFAVIGFDNTDITNIYNPTISTVSQSQQAMGHTAMELLVRKMENLQFTEHVILRHELFLHASTEG